MKKRLWLLLIILCWTGAGFAIFGLPTAQNRNTAPLPRQVDRIVSTASDVTEILFALGLDEKIAAVSDESDYPPQAINKNKVGTFWQPNIEAVIAAKPDLVITLGFEQQKNLAERLSRIGCSTLIVNIDKVSELFDAIEKIGTATDTQSKANELAGSIKMKLSNLSALVSKEKKVRVLWVVQREPLRVAGRDTFINELIELAGGENAIGPTLHKYPPIGAEMVYACGADVIIEPTMGQENLTQQQDLAVKYWSRFANVPAVKNGRIYVIDGDVVSRLGPRLYESIETIARYLRPELFTK